jgi:hypothetical protein
MDPGLRREDGRRKPRVTNVKFGPPVVRDELCVQAGLDKVADQLK